MKPYATKPSGSTTGHLGGTIFRLNAKGIAIEQPIIGPLKMGESLSVPTLFGRVKPEVTEMRDDHATAMSGDMICWLTFAQDDRMCWACGATGDSKALVKGLIF